jgi:hypothetical protein
VTDANADVNVMRSCVRVKEPNANEPLVPSAWRKIKSDQMMLMCRQRRYILLVAFRSYVRLGRGTYLRARNKLAI